MRLRNIFIYTFFISVFIVSIGCKEEKSTKAEDKVVVSFKKEGTLHIKKADTDSIIKTFDIEIADNEYETQTGLMYRTELELLHGMLFIFPNSDYRSLLPSESPAKYVLEINAGLSDEWLLEVGDTIEFIIDK